MFLLFICVHLARSWSGLGALGMVWGLPGGSLGGGLGALGVFGGVRAGLRGGDLGGLWGVSGHPVFQRARIRVFWSSRGPKMDPSYSQVGSIAVFL